MAEPASAEVRALIARLGLEPHPEGNWYRQTFRDASGGGRGHSTAIYYLMAHGHRSHWHRVDAAEVWHYYAGAHAQVSLSADGKSVEHQKLGPNVFEDESPQVIVPAGCWQSAETLGDWTLVGCTVAPGFDFSGFELAAADWQPG